MNKKKKLLLIIGVILVLLVAAMLILTVSRARQAEPGVAPYLQSSDTVLVEQGRWLTFSPADRQPTVGFIFYPGAYVTAPAYAPTLYRIAEFGFLVVDVPMPLNFAVLGVNRASKIISAHPEIETWVIGGHSLGGVMSSSYAYNHPEQIAGVALWASYPAESSPLTGTGLKVISIYGTLDGLATVREIQASFPLLPEDTVYIPIAGGNHAQFGFYGEQNGDMPAMISREAQQDLLVQVMVAFLEGFE